MQIVLRDAQVVQTVNKQAVYHVKPVIIIIYRILLVIHVPMAYINQVIIQLQLLVFHVLSQENILQTVQAVIQIV